MGSPAPSDSASHPPPASSSTVRPREELVSEINARLRRNAAAAAKRRTTPQQPHTQQPHKAADSYHKEEQQASATSATPHSHAHAEQSERAHKSARSPSFSAASASSSLALRLPSLHAPLTSATLQALHTANLSSPSFAHTRPQPSGGELDESLSSAPALTAPPPSRRPAALALLSSSSSRRMTFKALPVRLGRAQGAAADVEVEDELQEEGEDSEEEVDDDGDCGFSPSLCPASSPHPVLLMRLGSAAFDSAADAIERQQRQQSHAAMPFIHRLTAHTAPLHNTPAAATAPNAPTSVAVAEQLRRLLTADERPAPAAPDAASATAPLRKTTTPSSHSDDLTTSVVSTASAASSTSSPSPSSSSPSSAAAVDSFSGCVVVKAHHTLLLLCCEVLSSEATYVSRLDDLLLHYVTPLKQRHSALGLAREDVYGLFSYIEPIVDLHHQLLQQLLQARPPPLPSSDAPLCIDLASLDRCLEQVACTFLSYHPYLKMYNAYVNQFNQSMERLKRLSDTRKFVRFLEHTHTQTVLDLPSYLIMPVQRIPRYELFLTSMLRLVEGGDVGVGAASYRFSCAARLSSALCQVQSIAAVINESKRLAEAGEKMLELKKRLKGFPSSTQLLAPHRRLLREDAVLQLLPKRREYVLVTFNDAVLLVSHAWRVKGFYRLDDLACIRHYEPHAQHRAHLSSTTGEEEREQPRMDDGEAEEDDEGDDAEYASSVELELKKPRDKDAAGGPAAGGAAWEGRGGLKLRRFSLAFTAAVAALTEQHTIVLQFHSEQSKHAWVHDLHRATAGAVQPATAPSPAAAPSPLSPTSLLPSSSPSSAPSSSSSLFVGSLLASAVKLSGGGGLLPSSSPSSAGLLLSATPSPLSSPLSTPASAPPSPSPSPTSACAPPQPLPTAHPLSPSFSSPAAPTSALLARVPPLGAVPVLPARPRPYPAPTTSPTPAQTHTRHTSPAGRPAAPATPTSTAPSPSSSSPSCSCSSSSPFSYSLPQLSAASNPALRSLLAPTPVTPSSGDSGGAQLHSSRTSSTRPPTHAHEGRVEPSPPQSHTPARPALLSEWSKQRQQQMQTATEGGKENQRCRAEALQPLTGTSNSALQSPPSKGRAAATGVQTPFPPRTTVQG